MKRRNKKINIGNTELPSSFGKPGYVFETVTLFVDEEILNYFRDLAAEKNGTKYQDLISEHLSKTVKIKRIIK